MKTIMRINRFVASASGLSRRASDAAVAAGRVIINGQTAHIGDTVPDNAPAAVTLDSRPLTLPTAFRLIAFHKPVGYVSSRTQQGSDPTLYSLLPKAFHSLRIVGRLDRDSSGLILLSDDGDFVHRHTHPSFDKIKIYDITTSRDLTPADRRRLETGVMLTDGPSRLTVVRAQGREVRVSLREGRNRQIRRTFGALGYETLRLHRQQIGPYELGDLPEGAWREILFS
jgi:23S rRNA pseudouridine2605 synthase